MLARHSRLQMFLLAGMMLLASACAPTVAGPTTPAVEPTEPAPEPDMPEPVAGLEGIEWFLWSYGPAGQEVELLPNSTITIQFAEGELSGSAGCNGYFGSYQTAGDSLTVGMLGNTEMWCEGLMDQETAYLALLGAVETVSLEGEELILEGTAGRLIYAKTAPEPQTPDVIAGLEGIEWFLSSYGPAGQEVDVLSNSTISIQFAAGELSGSAGCNGYFGGYETAGDSLTVGMLGNTEMWCEGLMDQESAYLTLLGAVETVSLEGEELILEGPDGRLIYAKAAPVVDQPLVGPVWELETFILGDTAQSVLADSRITAEFGEDGRVSGSAGCNSYGSSYELDGDQVSFGLFAVTLMACLDGDVMDQESRFLELLQNADTLSVEGDHLTVRGPDGELIFRPAEHLSLEGVDWTLSGIAKGEAVVETWIDQEITARFENGRLEGSAGCNTYFADYQIENNTLTLGPVGSTRMACDEEHNQRENEFLSALDQVAGYEVRLTVLHLLDADGELLMQFRGE